MFAFRQDSPIANGFLVAGWADGVQAAPTGTTLVAAAKKSRRKGSKNQISTPTAGMCSARTGRAAASVVFLGRMAAGGSS